MFRQCTRLGVFLFLIACVFSNAYAFDDGELLDLSLTNEQCHLEMDKSPRTKNMFIYRIMCSDKEVGMLMPDGLTKAREVTERLQCMPVTEFSISGALAGFMVEPCRQKVNGLPFAVMRFEVANRKWIADAPPAVIPSVAVLANLPSLTNEQRKEVIAHLPKVWNGPVALLSGMQLHQVRTMLRDARAANQKGEFDLAENLHRELLTIQSKTMGPESVSVGETLLDLALNVSNQGRFEEADGLFRRAEPLISKPSSAALRARMKNYRCLDAANRGDFVTALAFARDAVRTWRFMIENEQQNATEAFMETWNGRVRSRLTAELTYALHLEAAMLLRNDDGPTAYERAGEALRLSAEVNEFPPEWRAEVMMTLGESAMSSGRMAAAEEFFRTAQQIRQQVFGPTLPSIKTLVTLARAFHSEGIDTSAVATYRQAFTQMVNSAGVKAEFLSSEELNDFVSAAFNLITREGFTQAQRLQLLEEVFYAFQMVRPSVVDKTISSSTSALSVKDPDLGRLLRSMMDKERQITSKRADLAEQSILPDEERDPEIEARVFAEIQEMEIGLREFRATMKERFPNFASMAAPGPLPLIRMQDNLGEKEALVSYLLGRKESFALLVKKDGLNLVRIPLSEKSIRETVQLLRKGLQPQAGGLGEFDSEESHELYRLIVGPFAEQLQGVEHLVVNATGALASLPFAVLLTRPPEAPGPQISPNASWLSRQYAISHISSIQAFTNLRQRSTAKIAPMPFFGIGNPTLQGKSGVTAGSLDKLAGNCRQNQPAPAEMIRALAALPDTAKEIQTIGQLLSPAGSRPWRLAGEAKEEVVRQVSLQDYRVLYFATHGLLPGELKCQTEPALVMTPPAVTAKDKASDGLLQASEIATLKLNADLVVLSACNTAGGSGRLGGEALSGLAEAFFYAGAKGLVVSHWQVPSEPTARLMSQMFTGIGSDFKTAPAKALSAAQRTLSSQPATAHPYFWAAFTVVGDGGRSL
jgi:CHAT domain-containing protein/tetratricopeptide (TPR) repeat protein